MRAPARLNLVNASGIERNDALSLLASNPQTMQDLSGARFLHILAAAMRMSRNTWNPFAFRVCSVPPSVARRNRGHKRNLEQPRATPASG